MASETSKSILAAPLVVAGTAKVSLVINVDKRETSILVGSYHLAGYVSPAAVSSLRRISFSFPEELGRVTKTEMANDLLGLHKDPLFIRTAQRKPEASEALSYMLETVSEDHVYAIFRKFLVLRKNGPPTKDIEFKRGTREGMDALCQAIVYRYGQKDTTLNVTGQIEDTGKVVMIEVKGSTHNENLLRELCNVAKTNFVYVGYGQRETKINEKESPGHRHLPDDWERFTQAIIYTRKNTPYTSQESADAVINEWCADHGVVAPNVPMIHG